MPEEKKKFRDTKVGRFLKDKAPSILDKVGDLLPDAGVLGIVKNLIDTDAKLSPADKALAQQHLKEMYELEVRVEYTQDLDGGIILEAADLIGIFLDNDKVAASLNHDIKLDICDLDADAIWLFEEIATNDALMNGPYGWL